MLQPVLRKPSPSEAIQKLNEDTIRLTLQHIREDVFATNRTGWDEHAITARLALLEKIWRDELVRRSIVDRAPSRSVRKPPAETYFIQQPLYTSNPYENPQPLPSYHRVSLEPLPRRGNPQLFGNDAAAKSHQEQLQLFYQLQNEQFPEAPACSTSSSSAAAAAAAAVASSSSSSSSSSASSASSSSFSLSTSLPLSSLSSSSVSDSSVSSSSSSALSSSCSLSSMSFSSSCASPSSSASPTPTLSSTHSCSSLSLPSSLIPPALTSSSFLVPYGHPTTTTLGKRARYSDDEEDDFSVLPLQVEEGLLDEPLGPADDIPDHDFPIKNTLYCQFTRVNRKKSRWRCVLLDGVARINEVDYCFKKASGEFEW